MDAAGREYRDAALRGLMTGMLTDRHFAEPITQFIFTYWDKSPRATRREIQDAFLDYAALTLPWHLRGYRREQIEMILAGARSELAFKRAYRGADAQRFGRDVKMAKLKGRSFQYQDSAALAFQSVFK